MVGGRRVGKTSMLAGLFNEMLHNDSIRQIVSIEEPSYAEQGVLQAKNDELCSELKKNAGKVVMDVALGTDKFHPFKLKVSIPGTGHSTNIIFTDANGEYYSNSVDRHNSGNAKYIRQFKERRNQLVDTVRKSDVLLIAIDTPFLMEGSTASNLLANCVDDIQGLLTELNAQDSAKLVVFAPIKCEKWAKEGRLDEVTQKIEQVYNTIIINLRNPLVEILVLPVQTVGSMFFKEFAPAYLYATDKGPLPCSPIDEYEKIRFANGEEKTLSEVDQEKLHEDSSALFLGSKVERPNSWFQVVVDAKYSPKNCEQLAYHILRYALQRKIDAEELQNRKRHSGISWLKRLAFAALAFGCGLGVIGALILLWGTKLGDISTDELQSVVNKLSDNNYIKDSGDGIKLIQSYQGIKK